MVLAKQFGVVFSIIRLFPAARQRTQVLDLLRSIQDLTMPSSGCLGCWVSEQDYSQYHIRYVEQWESEETLHNHIRSDLYRRVLSAMELSKRQPEIVFYHADKSQGFELIEEVRGELAAPPSIVSPGNPGP
jgi:quinol monooxygenase YgiN